MEMEEVYELVLEVLYFNQKTMIRSFVLDALES